MGFCCLDALLTRKRNLSDCQQNFSSFSSVKTIKMYTYNELTSATDNFHPRNSLGRGGFGTVYKGTLRNGTLVAAKVLSAQSNQGISEFLTEIDCITNVRHPNLVELIGCCLHGRNRILIYEYLENNSLDHALLGRNSEREKLNWNIRSSICVGTARGLTFLHEELHPPIVHRDIKASNILLDTKFIPKIGDFGLAKLFPDNATHISTRVAGTMGYLAPEYAMHGQLTKKVDVYSFGVLLLEIISGKSVSKATRSGMVMQLLEWTWKLYEEGTLREVVDPILQNYPEEEVLRYIKVALFCTQAAAWRRPSMPQVAEMLSKPAQLNESELTPPGLIRDLLGNSTEEGAPNSRITKPKGPQFSNFPAPLSSASIVTELVPR